MKKFLLVLLTVLIASMLLARPAANRATLNDVRESREFDWADQNSGFPNASTGINFMDHHKILVNIDNLLDHSYYEKKGFPKPGISLFVSYRYSF